MRLECLQQLRGHSSLEMTLRYVVETRSRRTVKAELHRELLEHFAQEPGITVASMTVEIVGFPPIKQQDG